MMPNNAKLHHNYAHSLTKDPAMKHAAEFHFREAIRIYPPYGSAYINLGVQVRACNGPDDIGLCTVSCVFLIAIPPHTRRVMCSTSCPYVLKGEWEGGWMLTAACNPML